MRFYYGDKNIIRILDEIVFWKRQETEHTVVIRKIIDDLEDEFVKELESFEKKFYATEEKAAKYIEILILCKCYYEPIIYQQIIQFIDYTILQSKHFIGLLKIMIKGSNAVSNNPVAETVINHIIRESEYFIDIAQTILCY